MITQPQLIADILTALETHGAKDLLPRHVSAVIEAADLIVAALQEPERPAPPGCGLDAWRASDQTGLSSRFMAYVLAMEIGFPTLNAPYAHPYDPADFGRCLGLLESCPELRPHVPKMAATSTEWALMVEYWAELEALYRAEAPTGECPQLWARMKTLLTRPHSE